MHEEYNGRFSVSRVWAAALVLVAGLVGCDRGPEIVPVSGRLTLDGEAFAGARITTQPVGDIQHPEPGPGSFGTTDQDGRYSLELQTHPEPGAVVGTHRISITMEQDARSADPTDDRGQAPSRRFPEWFANYQYTIEVPSEGTDKADLDVSVKAPPKPQ